MKSIIALALFSFLVAGCHNRRISADKIPSVVVNTVKQKFPDANDVDWKKLSNAYEAEIRINDSMDVDIQVDPTGKIVQQKEDLSLALLPVEIVQSVRGLYPGYEVEDVEKLVKDGVVYYQVELDAKGKKELNVVLSQDGKEEKTISYWD